MNSYKNTYNSNKLNNCEETRIAIIGMACRFPGGASNPEAYWNLLKNKRDASCEIPENRWDIKKFYSPDSEVPGKAYVKRGSFLQEGIDQFDSGFFGISTREATPLDPQQRLLLELTWEAFEDAGVVAGNLSGTKSGVYIGGFTLDNQIHLLNVYNREAITTHTAISSTVGMLSNRISYTFNLRGPSLTVDTACSSSAVAIHLACRDLLSGGCNLAVTGGVNVMIRPEYMISMCKGGFLAADGRCKTFDKSADGYGRGEGAGILILKRLTDAIQDGDPIHAVIVDSAVNQDGHSDGITAPNADSQIKLLEELYQHAGVFPEDVQYIEAHGTGTKAGDKAETTSIGTAVATQRSGSSSLIIGSCKTNIGHLEAAAAVAAVIKTVLCLKNKVITPNLHFKEPNPEIDFDKLRLKVPVELTPWPKHKGAARAGVNSFGFGGTNAHIILEEAPKIKHIRTQRQQRPMIFPVTAAASNSLLQRIRRISATLEKSFDVDIEDIGYTLGVRQSHLKHRYAAVASNMEELRESLYIFNSKAKTYGSVITGPRKKVNEAKCAFVFTGMGPQYWGMGMELLEKDENARRILARCDEVWKPLAGWSLQELFSDGSGLPMNEPWQAQPGNFVLQVMLAEIAKTYGLTPSGIIGHSVGEIAAAYIAGALTLREALTVTYNRSRLQQQKAGAGRMLAVQLSQTEIVPYLEGMDEFVSIAAINSFNSITLSGSPEALQAVSEKLSAEGHFNRLLAVEVAYHSYQMESLNEEFLQDLQKLSPQAPEIPLYSSVTGEQVQEAAHNAGYWWKNLRNTVCFSAAISQMIKDGYNTFIEIGPHPVLASAIKDGLQGTEGETFASQNRKEPQFKTLCVSIAALFARGVHIDWGKLYPSGNLVRFGSYPWDKETVWYETELSKADRLGIPGHPLLRAKKDEPLPVWEGELSLVRQGYLNDHRIQQEVIFPGAGYVEMALAANLKKGSQILLENFKFHQTLEVLSSPVLRLVKDSDGEAFSIYSRSLKADSAWVKNASGKMFTLTLPEGLPSLEREQLSAKNTKPLMIDAFYQLLKELGLEFGSGFKTLKQGFADKDEILTEVEVNKDYKDEVKEYFIHPTLLDGAFQSLLALAADELRREDRLYIPFSIGSIYFCKKPGSSAWCHGRITARNYQEIHGDIAIYDSENNLCVQLKDVAVRGLAADKKAIGSELPAQYINKWVQVSKPAAAGEILYKPQTWLVFTDQKGIGAQLLREAVSRRISCVEVSEGRQFERWGADKFKVRRNSSEDIEQLFRYISDRDIGAVVYLWGLDIQDKGDTDYSLYAAGTVDVTDLTHIVQSMGKAISNQNCKFCIGLCRAQAVGKDILCRNPGQNALIGFARVLGLEYADYQVRVVDLNSLIPGTGAADLLSEIMAADKETEIAYRNNIRYAARLERYELKDQKSLAEKAASFMYQSDSGHFAETARRAPAKDEIEIAVHTCYPVNLSAVVRNPSGERILSYCCGAVTRVGDAVSELSENQRVVVLSPQENIRSFATLPAGAVIKAPEGMSFHEAVTLPEWIIAYEVLFNKGNLHEGETVLVHQVIGRIQLAVVLLAKWKGAEVFATHDGQHGREQLAEIGADYVLDSSNFGFIDKVRQVTCGKGINIIVSSAGLLMQKSIELSSNGGKYICFDDGSDESEKIPVRVFAKGIQFHIMNTKALCFDSSERLGSILGQLKELGSIMNKFEVKPLSITRIEELLKIRAKGEITWAAVLEVYGEPVPLSTRLSYSFIKEDAAYVVTGGWGGMGLETLRWLAEHDARNIIVLSRSGGNTPEAQKTVSELQIKGVRILDERVDISDGLALAQAIDRCKAAFPEIRGVIHTAGIIDDAALDSLTDVQIQAVMKGKALGAWNLHHALRDNVLDFFICYSSVASMTGNSSQANYAAANAFLDGLMQYRRGLGQKGLSINWGVIEDVGMAAGNERLKAHLERIGIKGITSRQGLRCILPALFGECTQIGIFNMDWKKWASDISMPAGRIAELVKEEAEASVDDELDAFRRRIIREDSSQRIFAVTGHIVNMAAAILKIESSRIESNSDLVELGIDSLMAQELAAEILKKTGVRFRALYLLRGATISEISEVVLNEILEGNKDNFVAVR
ncbi:acyl transferase domain-containing protein [Ruminiclostridium sufflavum DSM 19573]|uniref:Acyl transferase domain-containing protein n=1 Tax=Ruminiclostridium sufflavum DSM 19573 TaxID=1121337 RepID=A0A318XRY6_9FIRM|nr:type I polyketide synthase [Ruminiclostridium sufflavum]PYG90367.1 acyl transferase domain-containing protein [Ruminiclostridium sufflavum DSM 19573]